MVAGARSNREALERYYAALSHILSCVSGDIWVPGQSPFGPAGAITFQIGPHFGQAVPLRREDGSWVYLGGNHTIEFGPDPEHHSLRRVRSMTYAYHICSDEDVETSTVIAWHWHPLSRDEPHLHVDAAHGLVPQPYKLHQPTGRVAFESVVRYLVHELSVHPRHTEWEEILAEEEQDYRRTRSWS